MRFYSTVALLCACLASAATVSESHQVPGGSPLQFCEGPIVRDFVDIKSVKLSPNPPQAGKNLTINAHGTVHKDIVEGAYVRINVKWGLITLINTVQDLCEQTGHINLKCPIKAGDMTIEKSFGLPIAIPDGTYNVKADVFSQDDSHITCLTASVTFHGNRLFNIEL
ncbi:Phosphatidylglycerol/phosphatidylinositol transfer protein [Ophiocordyceps camponoti-floridani]|uniref:Phosphatidylglycerol/phosphatidylinositol transfer protein n=1 Tax=Ophiocordyceps camponoti-floridani TaxID=2030778 RepID=A0A8H4Q5U4_9HYPO|nr:Phosphatidylglycerol/phosphatidylinositol transfer protein [Ophiocordyceps camponoti-floridani]